MTTNMNWGPQHPAYPTPETNDEMQQRIKNTIAAQKAKDHEAMNMVRSVMRGRDYTAIGKLIDALDVLGDPVVMADDDPASVIIDALTEAGR